MSIADDLFAIADRLKEKSGALGEGGLDEPVECLLKSAEEVGNAWSGSWLGYHARVYYADFSEPPAGAHFSQEWGFMDTLAHRDTRGDWQEFQFDAVVTAIYERCGNPDLTAQKRASDECKEEFEEAQAQLKSLLSTTLEHRKSDGFLQGVLEKVDNMQTHSESDFLKALRPSGQLMSRDSVAAHAGLHTPPHVAVLVEIYAIKQPFTVCEDLSKQARRAASHMRNTEKHAVDSERIGVNVFIGHGRSAVWRDLKDFIQDRMRLPWDEFNRVPVAGATNVARLAQMLDEAAIAFLVMTAEDEQADGKQQARQNVIHEAGLFQGRLGFQRAILLVEEGCEEFSNVEGLGQIRFPKDNISAVFEEIRRVFEREGLVDE